MIDALLISAEQFQRSPQTGDPWSRPWDFWATLLSTPHIGAAKGVAGGLVFGVFADNIRRKANFIRTRVLSFDFDQNGVDEVAPSLSKVAAFIPETFSSTPEAGRCRAFVQANEDLDGETYDRLHAIMRARFRGAGLPADEGAKDCCRLSYCPVRRPGTGYKFVVTPGEPIDVQAVLLKQPPTAPRTPPRLPDPQHADVYARAALRRAAEAVIAAKPGERHYVLARESFCLARLAIADHEIAAALVEPFAHVAGEARRREGARTVADAIRARRGTA